MNGAAGGESVVERFPTYPDAVNEMLQLRPDTPIHPTGTIDEIGGVVRLSHDARLGWRTIETLQAERERLVARVDPTFRAAHAELTVTSLGGE